jgi:membrane-bound lytic murein transglycosylase D
MMKNLVIVFSLLLNIQVWAQVKVPETMYFAGLKLEFNNHVQRTLQTEVDNIRRNPTFFKQKVDRADLYFPLIEKVFQEEGLHDDFKYLVLQESSLVSDAVSSSNAVGYWQFKKESAEEVGLRCDQYVDERMNIVSASRGAAKYLQRNNRTLQNWVYALLSYNLGLGGVRKEVDDKYVGAPSMKVTDKMHWYVIRFLAHKLAYENEVGKNPAKEMYLVEYTNCAFKSVDEIAAETKLSAEEVAKYNKWMQKKMVPNDKEYVVILPVAAHDYSRVLALANSKPGEAGPVLVADSPQTESGKKNKSSSKSKGNTTTRNKSKTPDIVGNGQHGIVLITTHNKLKAILAKAGDTFEAMAIAAGVKLDDFIAINEVKRFEKPIVGKYYYIQSKRNKALISQHIVQYDETLWSISQQYGMRTNAIRKKNRMSLREEPKVGRVLNLRKKIKKGEQIEYRKVTPKEEPRKTDIVKPVEKTTPQKNVEVAAKEPEPKNIVVEKSETPSANKDQVIPNVEITKPAKEESQFIIHTVVQGETLYRLSKMYDISIDTLKAWNDLSQGLKVGQVVKVGINKSETVIGKEHIVQSGETLYRISKIYGITIDDIMKWNEKTSFSVSVGEVLKIFVD